MTTDANPKYPEVQVQLVGEDGNAFAILARVRKAMADGGVPREEIQRYVDEATAGSYQELLATTTRWVEVL